MRDSTKATVAFLLLGLSGVAQVASAGAAEPLTVMTYNILYDDTRFGNTQIWHKRKDAVARIMQTADIIGTQEPTHSQVEYLKAALPGYDVIGVGNRDGKTQGLFCALFYRTARFTPLTSGTFWLSQRPDQAGSRGWDARSLRITTWAQFKDVAGANRFFVFNTHFDHKGKIARRESARLLLEKINTIAGRAPVLVVGDLNAEAESPMYTILTQNGREPLRNAYDLTDAANRHGPNWTFVKNFKNGGIGKRQLDFILARGPGLHFEHYAVIDHKAPYGGYPSDHLPVMATLRIVSQEKLTAE